LKIDELTIRAWKAIPRQPSTRAHIYVEPGDRCRVRLGSIDIARRATDHDPVVIFQLSANNQVGFRVLDREILQLNLRLADTQGREVVRVVEGYLAHEVKEPVQYESRTGKVRITAPPTPDYLPPWVLERFANERLPVVADGRFTALDIEVLDRGLVHVQGVWAEGDAEDGRAVVAASDSFGFTWPGMKTCLAISGDRGSCTLVHTGPGRTHQTPRSLLPGA
jgi:hypothetical protein